MGNPNDPIKLRELLEKVLGFAAEGIYFGKDYCQDSCWDVVKEIDPDFAELLHNNELVAMERFDEDAPKPCHPPYMKECTCACHEPHRLWLCDCSCYVCTCEKRIR